MRLVEQRDPEMSVYAARQALNVSRASLYRSWRPPAPPRSPVTRERAPSPRRLDDAERKEILDTLHLPEFADQPPTEIYATLLERGTYLASIRTMYRVLAEAGEAKERRNQRAPQQHAMPSLTATAPNQVCTWDITKLATLQKGVFLMAYVVIDLFSRFVIGWMVAAKEWQAPRRPALRRDHRASRRHPRPPSTRRPWVRDAERHARAAARLARRLA
jgi:putative transposase